MRALGIDYGERRIGLALSDPTGLLASPWKTISNSGDVRQATKRLLAEIAALDDDDERIGAIVIGLPRRLSGDPSDQTARVQRLCELLKEATTLPVALQDERLTSHEADELLARREKDWRRRKQQVDALAAALILQDYLDGQDRS